MYTHIHTAPYLYRLLSFPFGSVYRYLCTRASFAHMSQHGFEMMEEFVKNQPCDDDDNNWYVYIINAMNWFEVPNSQAVPGSIYIQTFLYKIQKSTTSFGLLKFAVFYVITGVSCFIQIERMNEQQQRRSRRRHTQQQQKYTTRFVYIFYDDTKYAQFSISFCILCSPWLWSKTVNI